MKRIKRGTIPKISACLIAVALVFSIVTSITYAADEKYEKNYSIKNVLSDYQYVVQENASINNHTVGGMVIGGAAKISSFGDGAVAPSYFRDLVSYGNYSRSQYLKDEEGYRGYVGLPAFYKKANYSGGDLTKYEGDGDFFDFEKAFGEIRSESKERAEAGMMLSMKDLKKDVNMDNYLKGNLLIIPFDVKKNITVPGNVWDEADFILLDGLSGYSDLAKNEYTVNIMADEVKAGGDYNYIHPGDKKKCVFLGVRRGTNNAKRFSIQDKEKEETEEVFGLNTEQGNGMQVATLGGSIQGGQMNLAGMKLLWNMPEAKSVETCFLPGHVAAPDAKVKIDGGNFEGGYIAKSLKANGEAHFYPWDKVKKDDETPTPEPTETPEVKTPEPTETPEAETPKPTETPEAETPAPTETPEAETPAPTETPEAETPAPTETPKAETPAPTEPPKAETPKPTEPPKAETPAPTKPPKAETPKPKKTPEPTKPPKAETPKPTKPPVAETPKPTKPPKAETPKPTKPPVAETPKPTKPPVAETPKPTKPPKAETPAPTQPPVVDTPAPTEPPKAETPVPTEVPVVTPVENTTEAPAATPVETVPGETPAPDETAVPDVSVQPEATATPLLTLDEPTPPAAGASESPVETAPVAEEAAPTPTMLTVLDQDTPLGKAKPEKKVKKKSNVTTILDEDVPLADAAPETGDTTNLFIPILGLGLSVIAVFGILLYRRKRD